MNGERYCANCLKHGCNVCRPVEGGTLCAFCEDGLPCPIQAKQIAARKAQGEKQMSEVLCKCGCGQPAPAHREYIWGHKSKTKPAAAKSEPKDAKAPKAQPASAETKTRPASAPKEAHATIHVSEAHLDGFWAKLALEEKAALFQNHLDGASAL